MKCYRSSYLLLAFIFNFAFFTHLTTASVIPENSGFFSIDHYSLCTLDEPPYACVHHYDFNASPSESYRFSHWEIDGLVISQNPYTIYFYDSLNGIYDEGESFTDALNGVYDLGEVFTDSPNGVYDLGEAFTDSPNGVYDLGEDFVDSIGNGVYDLGEEFVDAIGNGIYDLGEAFTDTLNGVYDEGEAFVDTNGVYDDGVAFTDQLNGVYDDGEQFTDALNGSYDQGEDFVDSNGNGVYNDREEFIDINTNGQWDPEYRRYKIRRSEYNDSGYWGTGEREYQQVVTTYYPDFVDDVDESELINEGWSLHQIISEEDFFGYNGEYDEGEVFIDAFNGEYDEGEAFVDDGNGVYDVGEVFVDALNNAYDPGEDFVDLNGNGVYDLGEAFTDALNGVYDGGEEFTDALNGVYDQGEDFVDSNSNGVYDSSEEFVDLNGNGVYDIGEPFTDANGVYDLGEAFTDALNGVYDYGEEFTDALNGVWDPGESLFDFNGNGVYDLGEAFTDALNGVYDEGEAFTDALNGVYDYGEDFVDSIGNGFYDYAESFTDALNGVYDAGGGSGYDDNNPPTVTITGDGTGATATATVENGIIRGITITDPGIGYTEGGIIIAPPPAPGKQASAYIIIVNGEVIFAEVHQGEVFVDSNGNGVYDIGEPFTDALNGVYDVGEDFTDALNGVYDYGEEFTDELEYQWTEKISEYTIRRPEWISTSSTSYYDDYENVYAGSPRENELILNGWSLNSVIADQEPFTDSPNGVYNYAEDFTDALDGAYEMGEDMDVDGILDLVNEDVDGDGKLDIDEDVDGDGNLDVAEDIDGDGNLDVEEDLDNDNNFDFVNEDLNGNGILDVGEDLDGDNRLDLGIEDIDGDGNFDIDEDVDGDGNLDVAEDIDGDGNLDVAEDLDLDGNLDVAEDLNGNGVLDSGEDFVDSNGNGVYDSGEEFTDALNDVYDQGEDFVDLNGNGFYDYAESFTDAVNGVYDLGEAFVDSNGNGIYDIGEDFVDAPNGVYDFGETFTDTANGVYDLGEAFTDAKNGVYDLGEAFTDALNGVYDEGEDFVDTIGNGVYDLGEEFTDTLNGVYDEGEDFVDTNGVYDLGEEFTDSPNGVYDLGEDFVDSIGNGVYDLGEDFVDAIGNGIYDLGEEFTDALNGVYDEGEDFVDSFLNYIDPSLIDNIEQFDVKAYFVQDNIIFVDKDAADGGDGTSWAKAYKNIQDPLLTANEGDQIWIKGGTYYPDEGGFSVADSRSESFIISNGISLYGGFVGNELSIGQRDLENNPPTILSGDIDQDGTTAGNSYHIMIASDDVVIDGFTFQDGYADGLYADSQGSALYCIGVNPTIENNIFQNNYAGAYGGAIYQLIQATLKNNRFLNNSAQTRGGAIYGLNNSVSESNYYEGNHTVADSSKGGAIFGLVNSRLNDDEFLNNTANISNINNSRGGAIANSEDLLSDVTDEVYYRDINRCSFISNCKFEGNSAQAGGALYGIYYIENSIFKNNASTLSYYDSDGEGLAIYGKLMSVNNQFISNGRTWYRIRGGALRLTGAGESIIYNTDFISNGNAHTEVNGGAINASDHNTIIVNCLFENNGLSNWGYDGSGAVIRSDNSTVQCYGSLFVNNWSRHAVYGNSSNFEIINCTFNNKMKDIYFDNHNDYGLEVINSIFWHSGEQNFNDNPIFYDNYNSFHSIISHSSYSNLNGVSSSDPFFQSAGNYLGIDGLARTPDDGYSIRSVSPAIDAGADVPVTFFNDRFDADGDGDTAEAYPYDLKGFLRVQGNGIDIGAYEYGLSYLVSAFNSPVGAGSVSGTGRFNIGLSTELTATPIPGYLFEKWTLSNDGSEHLGGSISVQVDGNKSYTAYYIEDANDNDGDGLTNYQENIIYLTDDSIVDTDSDSIPDGLEVEATLNPLEDSTSAINMFKNNLQLLSLENSGGSSGGNYTLDEIKDLRPGSVTIQVVDGEANINMDIESSTDLENWEIDSAITVPMPIEEGEATKFFRFKMAE